MLIITDWKWHFVCDHHVVQNILQLRQKGCPNLLYHFFKDPSTTHPNSLLWVVNIGRTSFVYLAFWRSSEGSSLVWTDQASGCTKCARNTWRYTKFENHLACYAGLPNWRSSCAIMYGTYVHTTQISVQVLRTMFPRRLVPTFADILPARSSHLAIPDYFFGATSKRRYMKGV